MHCTAHKASALDVCVVREVTVLDVLCVLVRIQCGCTVISPLRCGAGVAFWEPSAHLIPVRWTFGLLKLALGLSPRPTVPSQRWALIPSSGSVCGSSVFHGCFIVIRGVLRHPHVGPVVQQCTALPASVIIHLQAFVISAVRHVAPAACVYLLPLLSPACRGWCIRAPVSAPPAAPTPHVSVCHGLPSFCGCLWQA